MQVYSLRGSHRGIVLHDHTYATFDEAQREKQKLYAQHPQWKIGIKPINSEQPLIVFRNGRWVSRKSVQENPVSMAQWGLIYAGVVGIGVVAYELLKKPGGS